MRLTNFKSEYEEEGFISGGRGGGQVRIPCTLTLDLLLGNKVIQSRGTLI